MIVPLLIARSGGNPDSDPVAADFTAGPTTGGGGGGPNQQTLIIVSTILGSSFLLIIAIAVYFTIIRRRRKRQFAEEYKTACLRDPDLTWEEYTRRTKLTRSRIMLAEEELRDTIIRKSLQNRSSVTVTPIAVTAAAAAAPDTPTTPVSPPARTRSKTWHGRSRSRSSLDAEEGEGLLMSLRGDWTEHEARVERTWQLLHKKYPTRRVTLPVEEDSGGPIRPPTIRLKTPPLLSHPMFRGWNGESTVKHSSVPTELEKMRPAQI
ncbi:hypothetical protein CORC01_00859 [Colletotrichum orchidophilum]|uniref:Uncharacterized protein n=1 Tax=Colletotrichum orchidophilum TaxID=1209926 RepID=A0A1G4BRU7_9PEZI|nr:uncharacterized protein CORC01_00859 [Colletotrichum orchidophilum]OHF03997.1 hypothetical protein CORC01_00859 [Colletotrichum orchidophilum]